jgi:hypothetical protein
MNILRWFIFLPCAVLSFWLIYYLLRIIVGLTLPETIWGSTFLTRVFVEFTSSWLSGAVFVYVGARIVPTHNKEIAYCLSGLGILTSGFLFYPAIIANDWWAIFGISSIVFGLIASAYSIYLGELKLKSNT